MNRPRGTAALRLAGGSSVVATAVIAAVSLAACVPAEDRTTTMTLAPIQTTSTTIPATTLPTTTIPQYYEVQGGDTLVVIAVGFGLPVEAIMDLNGIVDRNAIRAGDILRLPPPDIVADALPPTVPGQTAPTIPGPVTVAPGTTVAAQVAIVPAALPTTLPA